MISKFFVNSVNESDLYLNAKDADVFFALEDKDGTIKRIPAHAFLLKKQSKVFEAMVSGNWKNEDIKLIDISFGAFMQFLEYFYLNHVRITYQHVLEVMLLGDRYYVEKCVDDCSQFLGEVLNNENILTILHCAIICRKDELVNLCERRLISNTSIILQSTDFLDCDKTVLGHILQLDSLSCPEVEILTACMNWVKGKSNQSVLSNELVEKHLGGLFYQIRFASITMEQLCKLPHEYDEVLASHFQTIARMIVLPEFESQSFNNNIRQVTLN